MAITLDNILVCGILCAFIMPALATVLNTLPPPTTTTGINLSASLNSTGAYVNTHLVGSISGLSTTLIGTNCFGNGTIAKACNVTGGSFSANPTIFQAFAFVISNMGTIMLDVVQLPYLDYVSLNTIINGMAAVLPVGVIGFIQVGTYLLYLYMGLCMLFMGWSSIAKYSVMSG